MMTSESGLNDCNDYYKQTETDQEDHDHNFNVVINDIVHNDLSLLGRRYHEQMEDNREDAENITDIRCEEHKHENNHNQRRNHPKMGVLAKTEVLNWLIFKTESSEENEEQSPEETRLLEDHITDNIDHLNNNAATDNNLNTVDNSSHHHQHFTIFECSQECFDQESQCRHQAVVIPSFSHPN